MSGTPTVPPADVRPEGPVDPAGGNATPVPSAPSAVRPPAKGPPSRGRGSRSRWILVAVVGVVAAVLVLAGLYAAGVGPFAPAASSSGTTSSAPTFSEALASANASATHYGGGPWKALLASGVSPRQPLLESTAVPGDAFSGCTGVDEAPNTPFTTFEGFSGNFSTGEATAWIFFLINDSGDLLMSAVLGADVLPLELFHGSGCAALTAIPTIPSSAVDSATAAEAAFADGGYGFVGAHPGGGTTYSVSAGGWSVDYTTCPGTGHFDPSQTYYHFVANVSLTTGAVSGTPESGAAACSSDGFDNSSGFGSLPAIPSTGSGGGGSGTPATALDTVLAFGSSVNESEADYFYDYEINVTADTAALVLSDLEFSVNSSSGSAVSAALDVQLLAPSGCALAFGALNDPFYLDGPTDPCTSGTSGGEAPVAVGDVVEFQASSSLTGLGDTLVVYSAISSYSGDLRFSVP